MRELTSHKVNGCNEKLVIFAQGEPTHGGANHSYIVAWPKQPQCPHGGALEVHFQDGPIKENGVNGITNEALLAILIDRLEGFQSGPYACEENADALLHLDRAMEELKTRTEFRLARGVEGTHTV